MSLEISILILGLVAVGVSLHRKGFNLHRFREYKAGREVDGTQEWQAFKDAFEVRK